MPTPTNRPTTYKLTDEQTAAMLERAGVPAKFREKEAKLGALYPGALPAVRAFLSGETEHLAVVAPGAAARDIVHLAARVLVLEGRGTIVRTLSQLAADTAHGLREDYRFVAVPDIYSAHFGAAPPLEKREAYLVYDMLVGLAESGVRVVAGASCAPEGWVWWPPALREMFTPFEL